MRFPHGVLLLFFAGFACAANSNDKSADLKQQRETLRGQIGSLQKDLSKSEASKADVAKQLREVELAIDNSNRQLRELSNKRDAVQAQLNELEQQSRRLSAQIDSQQKQLSRLLYQQFVHGNDDALHVLLSGEDPNQSARDRHFLTLLSREKADLLGEMRGSLQEKKRLAEITRDKNDELVAIEKQQQRGRAALVEKQQQRQSLLATIAGRIKTQKKQIETLKDNEKRLGRLIDNLIRQASRPKSPSHKSPRQAVEPTPKRGKPLPEPNLASAKGVFASLRGKLPLPLRGNITGRFGAKHGDSGAIWKGLFISANEGTEVRSVADGQVVYADWLRGFGNLVIVDHGDGFLSVYGNNQSLTREAGKNVKAGETIATVGNGGGGEESGLYFELRHQGQPFDPLRWISLK